MRISRSLTILGSVLIMTLGAMWIANAAIPDANGNINACYIKPGGTLRVSDTGTCKKGETPISWNQKGVPGADGANGVSGYEVVEKISHRATGAATSLVTEAISCPDDKVVLGAFGLGLINNEEVDVIATSISTGGSAVTFTFGSRDGGFLFANDTMDILLRATCATMVTP